MGFLDKVKNLFTEEIEEEPIKKEVIQVEIPAPVENKVEAVAESEVLVKEEKPQTPVFFDDDDFANLERKEEKKAPKLEEKYKFKSEEKKVFKPTPIISPVYGVLDKNYHKEDITSKKKQPTTTYYERSSVTIEDVRKKAFGTLEDELETIIPSDEFEIAEEKVDIVETNNQNDIFEDLMDPDYEPRFAAPDLEETVEEEPKEENDMFEEMRQELEQDEDRLTESDLFNLIDSMYDKKEDE